MSKKLQTGTTKGQRIAIWAILILTVVSTVALYAASFLNSKNQAQEHADQQKKLKEVQKDYEKYKDRLAVQAKELSNKYYEDFKGYENSNKAFNAANVKELAKNDLKIGEGEEITKDSTEFTAYYIGWKPDGVVFDSSFENGSLKLPILASKNNDRWGVIEGWSEGAQGMKIGGIRELTIPANKAYGEAGSPNEQDKSKSIPANTPLKFIIMLVPKVEEIPLPDSVKEYYGQNRG